ncbi:hypothetical protein P8C59_009196 [Phyllachora maydis]|uniref:DUF7704 domain-containing protein n=1 Tax=Phyllachora maydis TaxID=1825666 RepID=A0AAD9IE74_9PEZI|nr:hypothetical protein P8C59_009196 [Phyllachora maydis]
MASRVPAFPRFVFTIFEPISLPAPGLIRRQEPCRRAAAGQLAVAVLYSTREVRVVRNYLVALMMADIGHVALTARARDVECDDLGECGRHDFFVSDTERVLPWLYL